MALEKERVCVTGAGGFIGSWTVKLLLSKDYFVHGTVREPRDEKNAHLYELAKASENLKLFTADLLDYDSLYSAIVGCGGVFHVATPVPSTVAQNPEARNPTQTVLQNPEVEMIEPAVKGTLNVLKACVEAKVKRVVVVSSAAAVVSNPDWPKGRVMDETCWSDTEHCRTNKNWYAYSKTVAESEALEYGKRNGLDVVTICPGFVFGPILQSTLNASSLILVNLLKGCEPADNRPRRIVDVRDVVEASILLYEKPEAEGRYICIAHSRRGQQLVDELKNLYPDCTYPKHFTGADEGKVITSEKLQKLGWSYRPLEETLVDSIESYKKAGILN